MGVTVYRNINAKIHVPKVKPIPATGSVAVILAAYKAGKWLEECVRSIYAQRLPSGWTLDLRIGVDGCEETASVLKRIGQPYFMSKKNVGTYIIRNSLMAVAPADAYAIFDADDVMLEGYLATLLRLVGTDGIAGAGRTTIDHNGKIIMSHAGRFSSGVCVISAHAMKKLGGYRPERIASDADLIGRAKLSKISVERCDEQLYHRRKHPASLTQAAPTRFGSRERVNVVAAHRRLRDEGAQHVDPVTTPMVWVDPTGVEVEELEATMFKDGVPTASSLLPDVAIRHSVYTRLKYDTKEAVALRLHLLRLVTAPAMAAQIGCGPIRWVFLCHERHEKIIEEAARAGGWNGEVGFNTRDDSEDIQTTLDSDDWIRQDWLKDVQAQFVEGGVCRAIYWQPLRLHLATDQWYEPKRKASWPSMFYSIYHPTPDAHVYGTKHPTLAKLGIPVSASPNDGMVALAIHGRNVHTKLKGSEVRIARPRSAKISREVKKYVVS